MVGFKCFSNELKNLELFKKAGGVFTSWLHVTINPLAVVVVVPAARMRCWQRCGLVVVSGESREKVQGSGSGGGEKVTRCFRCYVWWSGLDLQTQLFVENNWCKMRCYQRGGSKCSKCNPTTN